MTNLDELVRYPAQPPQIRVPAEFRARARAERLLIEEVGLTHPLAGLQLPHRDGIANAFEWSSDARTIEAKYGDGVQDLAAALRRGFGGGGGDVQRRGTC